jgi:hypothetical protein
LAQLWNIQQTITFRKYPSFNLCKNYESQNQQPFAIINKKSPMATVERLNYSQYWFYELLGKPEIKEGCKGLFASGFQQSGPMELNMAEFLGNYLKK